MSDQEEWWLERLVKDAQKERISEPGEVGGPIWAAGVSMGLFLVLLLLGILILGLKGVI